MSAVTEHAPLQVLGMSIASITDALTIADFFAKSDLVPKDYQGKPGNIVVAWQKGYEVGLQPAQALESIAVINGRACVWGDAALALVRASGLLADFQEEVGEKQAKCTIQRKGEKAIVSTFTMEDAKTAGLAGKQGPWTNYPKRMMQMRARGFALRDAFPDVLKGLAIAEEASDLPTELVSDKKKFTFTELQTAAEGLGLKLAYENGAARVVSGNPFNCGKSLQEMGFYAKNKQWFCDCIDDRNIVDTTVVETTASVKVEEEKEGATGEVEAELISLLPADIRTGLSKLNLSVSAKESGGMVYYQISGTVSADMHEKLVELKFQDKGTKGWVHAIKKEPTQGSLMS